MVLTRNITNIKISKFGKNFEQIEFYNGVWKDVEKGSYILAKWTDNWCIIHKKSELLKF